MNHLQLPAHAVSDFDRRLFKFGHRLLEREELGFDSIRQVVLSLPAEQVFFSRADLKIDANFDRAHKDFATGLSLESTLADMASTNSYVMVRQPDSHPRLKPVLELLMNELRDFVHEAHGRQGSAEDLFHDPMLYLFISSPNSVTPFHVDRYSTLLFQLQGQKDVMIWDRDDRETVTSEELEFLFGLPHVKNPSYKGKDTRAPEAVHLSKGDGVHIPFTSPHWVKNGPEVSVSVSFIFQTPPSLRQGNAHRFNYHVRRMLEKLPFSLPLPLPLGGVGRLPLLDDGKSALLSTMEQARRKWRERRTVDS
jgi:cupin-like protein